jgi:DnaK suppressor protein
MTNSALKQHQELLSMSDEDYMNAYQLAFFKNYLRRERQKILDHIEVMKAQFSEQQEKGDEADIAIREEQLRLLFRQIDRESRLLPKFDAALLRVDTGEYGFCEETGEPIGLERLLLRPTTDLSIEAKNRAEKMEILYRKK